MSKNNDSMYYKTIVSKMQDAEWEAEYVSSILK